MAKTKGGIFGISPILSFFPLRPPRLRESFPISAAGSCPEDGGRLAR